MELTKSKHVQPHWLDRGVIGFISKTESQVRKNRIISHARLWPFFQNRPYGLGSTNGKTRRIFLTEIFGFGNWWSHDCLGFRK